MLLGVRSPVQLFSFCWLHLISHYCLVFPQVAVAVVFTSELLGPPVGQKQSLHKGELKGAFWEWLQKQKTGHWMEQTGWPSGDFYLRRAWEHAGVFAVQPSVWTTSVLGEQSRATAADRLTLIPQLWAQRTCWPRLGVLGLLAAVADSAFCHVATRSQARRRRAAMKEEGQSVTGLENRRKAKIGIGKQKGK